MCGLQYPDLEADPQAACLGDLADGSLMKSLAGKQLQGGLANLRVPPANKVPILDDRLDGSRQFSLSMIFAELPNPNERSIRLEECY
jgi:hypothetical protein